jgi:hypothetical protein
MKKDKIVSIRQIHQRELAWLLYISEGYLANLDHAMAVNAVTMEAGDLAVIAAVRERAEANCGELRVLLQAMKD